MRLIEDIKKLFERDLDRLSKELDQYPEEDELWIVRGDISNSAGNLALHLCGNLKHFIGATLSDSGYVRNRPFEFEGKVQKRELEKNVEETKAVISHFFTKVEQNELDEEFPLQPFGYTMTVFEFILHLYGHLNYHLGQINYHRRILTAK